MPEILTGESQVLEELLNNPAVEIVAGLFTNRIVNPSEVANIGSLTPATFPGYAPIRVEDWDVEQHEEDALAEAISPPVEFVAGTIVTPQTVWGIYITSKNGADAPTLFRVTAFSSPFVFRKVGDTLKYQLRVSSISDQFLP